MDVFLIKEPTILWFPGFRKSFPACRVKAIDLFADKILINIFVNGGGVRERRQNRRIKTLLDQEGVVLVRHEGQMLAASLADLSADGALLKFPYSPAGIEAGVVLSMWLDSGGTFLKVEGIIVRTGRGHVAVQFMDLSAAERDEIRTKMIRMEIIAARLERRPMPPASDSNMTGAAR